MSSKYNVWMMSGRELTEGGGGNPANTGHLISVGSMMGQYRATLAHH